MNTKSLLLADKEPPQPENLALTNGIISAKIEYFDYMFLFQSIEWCSNDFDGSLHLSTVDQVLLQAFWKRLSKRELSRSANTD